MGFECHGQMFLAIAFQQLGMTDWNEAIKRNPRTIAAGVLVVIALVLITFASGVIPVFGTGYKSPHSITPENPSVTTAACSGNTIVVSYRGGPNAASLTNISIRVDSMPPRPLDPTIGSKERITPVVTNGMKEHRVIVVSTFTDGEMVIDQDLMLKCP